MKKYFMPNEKTDEVTLESDVKCCGLIWYVGFFCLNESRDVSDDTVALFPLFGNLNHRVLSSQASSTKCASSSSKVVSQILLKSSISWLFHGALIMIASPCFSQKKKCMSASSHYLNQSVRTKHELLVNPRCLPPLPHPMFMDFSLPGCLCCADTPDYSISTNPFQRLRHQGGGLPVFQERKLGHRRRKS